jgi:hypothetical protein
LSAGIVVASALTFAHPAVQRTKPFFSPAILGAQPDGATVIAREDDQLAVAVAIKQQHTRLYLVATVLGQDGSGSAGLETSFRITTRDGAHLDVAASPSMPGYYEASAQIAGKPSRVDVLLSGEGTTGRPVTFDIPRAWPTMPGTRTLADAVQAYDRLKTLVTHERLASRPNVSVASIYEAIAPHTLRIVSGNGTRAVIVGKERWDKTGSQAWRKSRMDTAIDSVSPYWREITTNATFLGDAVIDGRPTRIVSFAAPQMPAFFTVWIDKRTSRVLRLQMTAAAHFMQHRYGPSDQPLTIAPPTP